MAKRDQAKVVDLTGESAADAPRDETSAAQATVEHHRKRGRRTLAEAEAEAYERGKAEAAQLSAADLELFKPEYWKPIVTGPSDLLLAMTKDDIWKLTDGESDMLAVSGANCARYFLATDPKWIALTLFSIAMLNTYGARAIIYRMKHKQADAAGNSPSPGQDRPR